MSILDIFFSILYEFIEDKLYKKVVEKPTKKNFVLSLARKPEFV